MLLLIAQNTHASIFDKDDRIDTKFAPAHLQELARSVPALIQKTRIKELANGKLELVGNPMTSSSFNMCSDETFADESNIANCSASLIAKDKILTAGHCFNDNGYQCSTYSLVFDYHAGSNIVEKSQVYNCKNIIFTKFDQTLAGIDLAIIQLDREVEGHEPVELNLKQNLKVNDPLIMIGYPLGISQKVVEDGKVLSVDKKNVSFNHDLDSFSVNSGSPIFSPDGKQVGVLVRGTGPNLSNKSGEQCSRWHVAQKGDYSAGNDLSPLSKILKK